MICRTQSDVDAAVMAYEPIELDETWQDPRPAVIRGKARAELYDNARAVLYGDVIAVLHDDADVEAHGECQVIRV